MTTLMDKLIESDDREVVGKDRDLPPDVAAEDAYRAAARRYARLSGRRR